MQPTQFTSETWKPIPQHEGKYEVSDQGRFRRKARQGIDSLGRKINLRERYITGMITDEGHRMVRLYNGDSSFTDRLAHRVVAEVFLRPPLPGEFVLHWNDVPDDNRASNLRYGNSSDNAKDSVRNGTHMNTKKTHCPRGHILESPNLIPAALPKRVCLSCNRARNYAKRRGLMADFVEISHSYYSQIMPA